VSNAAAEYQVSCHACSTPFDALQAAWCSCLVTERTLTCPSCGKCFCSAPAAYKRRFWSEAPRALWDRKTAEHKQPFSPPPDSGSLARPLVLLVDDEPDIQRVATLVIGSLGYGLVVAKNGLEGLEAARHHHPDLVLTDALMPKLDGREMGRQLKADPETAGIKVVVMTGLYTNVKYEAEAYKSFKVDDYLRKPLDPERLRDVLRKHLG